MEAAQLSHLFLMIFLPEHLQLLGLSKLLIPELPCNHSMHLSAPPLSTPSLPNGLPVENTQASLNIVEFKVA